MHPMPPAHRRLPRFALATAGLLLALAAPNEAYAQTTCNVSDATTQATGAFNWHRISTNSGANLPAATVFYRTLITLGVSPLPAWTGSNISGNAPTTTITAAEARTFQAGSTWSGWNPILDALDCLEAQVVTPGPDPDPVPDPDFGPDPVPDPTLPVGPTHMPRIVLNRDEFVVEEPQADNCSDDKVGDETTWIPVDANKRPITDGSAPAFWKVERNYGPVLTAVGYKVALDRSPGAGKFVSVEIWDPTDLDRTDIWDGSSGAPGRKGRFEENARIHGTGWQLGRQGRITVANSELPGNPSAPVPYEAQPLTNTYLTFTDEDWDEPRKVRVNVHCAHHDVTNPLPVWHFAFRHDVPRPVNPGSAYPNGGAEELPLGYETNRKGDNSPNNTSLKIAQVRVVDSTAPAAITSDIAGGIELDPTRSLDVIKRSNGDGLVRRIGLEFTWNNPDTSHTNDYQHARENFTGFRVTLRSLEDGTVQERFVPTSGSTSIDDFQVPFYANFEAESIGVTVDAHGFAQPTDTNDEKFEWSVVPVNWRWDDVGAERVTRCVLLTYRKPNGTIPYIDTDATPTCPAAQQGESEGASTPAVSVPDTAVANVRATAVDDTSASVSWDAVEHATAYEVSWDGSGSGTAVTGILPGVTGTTTTIQHNAQEAMTLTVTVTPEYVDGNGQLVQLSSLAGTATLDVGPSGGSDDGGGTDGGDGGDAIGAGTDAVDLPAAVAHWRFDGDADDAAGSSDGAAMNGASFTADARSGSHALVLDGVDDHVDLASHVSNFPLGDAARSVTGWFKAEAGNQRQTFFTYGPNVAGQRFSIAADRTQALVAVSGHARGVNGLSLDDGWHHVAVTHAGGNSDGISIYLDGTLQPASTLVGAPQALDTRTGPAAIGRNAGGTEHYAGSIDDVRIYDVALGAEQVLALFNERPQTPPPVTTAVTASASPALAEGNLDGADVELTLDAGAYAATLATSDITASGVSGVGVSSVTRDGDTQATATLAFDGTDFDADATLMLTVSAGALAHSDAALSATLPVTAVDEPPPAVSIPTPVAHWRFDGDADDSAGSSNGSARNGASFTTAASVGTHALSLDGSDDHVDLASHASSFPLGNAARSVTGWFRADAGNQRQTFLTYGPNVEGKRLSIAADRTQAVVAVSGHAWGVNNLSLADGWHHVAVTFAGGRSDEFSIYLDGALQSAATLGGVRRQVDTRTGTAAIGRNVGGTAHYDGDIDDVRLYDHALSAEQVRAIAGRRETAGAGDGARATAALPGGPLPAPLARPRASGGADGTGADGQTTSARTASAPAALVRQQPPAPGRTLRCCRVRRTRCARASCGSSTGPRKPAKCGSWPSTTPAGAAHRSRSPSARARRRSSRRATSNGATRPSA